MTITHDSVTLTDGRISHRWTDSIFAYHWIEGGSTLSVGALPASAVGPRGWTFATPADVQRVYVRQWSTVGPVFYGVNSGDAMAAWHDPVDVLAVVRELADDGFTDLAFLFQFESARFLGNADGQAVIRGEARGRIRSDVTVPLDPETAGSRDFLPNDEPRPMFEPITADALADEIREALA